LTFRFHSFDQLPEITALFRPDIFSKMATGCFYVERTPAFPYGDGFRHVKKKAPLLAGPELLLNIIFST